MTMRFDRLAFRPVRAAARSSRDLLTDEAERAIGAVFAGPLPEAVARSLVEHHVLERMVSELLETAAAEDFDGDDVERLVDRVLQSPALERWIASDQAGRMAETVAERVVASDAFRRAMMEILSSDEVRRALFGQSVAFGTEVADAVRSRAGHVDDSAERPVRRLFRRRRATPARRFGGVATRAIALVVDAGLAQLAYLVIAGSIGLVLGLASGLRPGWFAGTLTGSGWFLVVALYFVSFWSATGQTPGMRLMGVRVVTGTGAPPSALRSVVRFAGLLLAILPAFAGFLPVLFDSRRRALQDFLAGTVVVYDPPRVDGDAAGEWPRGWAEAPATASTLT